MSDESVTNVIYVSQSEVHASDDKNTVLSTVLGSCIATCVFDEETGTGGMNHLLLPSHGEKSSRLDRRGINLMERLVNEMLKLGARKRSFVAKVFGGANVAIGGSTIGQRNCAFVKHFLEQERIPCVAESVGGSRARRIRYWPTSGRVSQLLLEPTDPRTELASLQIAPEPEEPSPEPEIWG